MPQTRWTRSPQQLWEYRYVLVNDVLEQAVAEMRAIVLSKRGDPDPALSALAANCRTDKRSEVLCEVLRGFGLEA